jgi:hypothetical protein
MNSLSPTSPDETGAYLRLRDERLRRGWTQLDVAILSRLTPSQIFCPHPLSSARFPEWGSMVLLL